MTRTDVRPDGSGNRGTEALRDALGQSFILVRLIIVCLAVAFAFSGVCNLEQFEQGIVLRFGAVHGAVRDAAGLLLALPYPVDEVVRVPTRRTQQLVSETYWHSDTADTAPAAPPAQQLLTGDCGLLHARATLKYRISDPVAFAFGAAHTPGLLRQLLDAAMAEVIGGVATAEALRRTPALSRRVTEVMARRLRALGIGVEVDPVDLVLDWPPQLGDEMNAIAQARESAARLVAAANVYAGRQRNEAESQASRVRAEALTWATRIISRTAADAETFEKLYPLYHANPDVIRGVLYQDAMRRIMAQVDEVFLVEDAPGRELRLRLSRRTDARRRGAGEAKKGDDGGR